MNQKKIGKFIQERRKLKELTQVELAEKLGVSNRTISSWENGNSLPDYSMFQDLCNELDISINELLSGEKLTEENYQRKLEENIVGTIDYNNNKRNKNIKKFIIIFIILIIIYFLYKAFIIMYFNSGIVYGSNSFPYNKNIYELKVNTNEKWNRNFDKNMKIYIPNEFILVTDKEESSFVKDNCDTYLKNQTKKDVFDASILVCTNTSNNIDNLDKFGIVNSLFPYLFIDHLLEKYNIEDTFDLIKYYEKHYDDKYNVFTSSDKIKMRYIAKQYVDLSVMTYDRFYYLTNDLIGYLIENDGNNKYQHLIIYQRDGVNNFKTYSISFYNNNENYFNHDNIIEIINSIKE